MTNSEDVFREELSKRVEAGKALHLRVGTAMEWVAHEAARLHTKDTQAKDQRIKDLEAKVKRLESDLDRKFQHYDAAERESSALREKLARCHEGYVARGRTIDTYEVDLTELCRSKAALESELSSSRAEVERLKAEVALRTSQMPMFVTMLRDENERLTKERDEFAEWMRVNAFNQRPDPEDPFERAKAWIDVLRESLVRANKVRRSWEEEFAKERDRCERAEKALADILSMVRTQVHDSVARTVKRVASEALSPGQPEGEKA